MTFSSLDGQQWEHELQESQEILKLSEAVRKYEALKKNEDFQRVYQKRRSCANKYLVMYIRRNKTDHNRLGISVSKKVGNSVVRHRVKRLIRESYRLKENKFHSGWDIVVIARNTAKNKSYQEIESALLHLCRLHGLWKGMEKS